MNSYSWHHSLSRLLLCQQEGDSQSGAQDGEDRAVSRSMGSLNGSRASYQYGSRRSRDEGERPPLLQLEILSGPSSGREVTIDDADTQARAQLSLESSAKPSILLQARKAAQVDREREIAWNRSHQESLSKELEALN